METAIKLSETKITAQNVKVWITQHWSYLARMGGSFLLFVTCEIMIGRHICLTRRCDFVIHKLSLWNDAYLKLWKKWTGQPWNSLFNDGPAFHPGITFRCLDVWKQCQAPGCWYGAPTTTSLISLTTLTFLYGITNKKLIILDIFGKFFKMIPFLLFQYI